MILSTLVTSQLHFEMCAGLYGHPVYQKKWTLFVATFLANREIACNVFLRSLFTYTLFLLLFAKLTAQQYFVPSSQTNSAILARVLCVAIATKRRRIGRRLSAKSGQETSPKSWKKELKVAARGVMILTPLLGITWMFGFLVGLHIICAYVFVFCNAFQASEDVLST